MLKFYEAAAPVIMGMVVKAAGIPKEQLGALKGKLDYAQYGGAPLLGVKGVSIICHGSSSPVAIKNGIKVGLRAFESKMSAHVGDTVTA